MLGSFFAGEAFLVLFALLFVVAVPVIVIGVIVFVLQRNSKNRAAWQKLSQSIGLTMPNPKKLELVGPFNGVDVRLAIGARRTGGGEDRSTEFFTYCTSKFPRSLRLNLEIKTDGGFFARALKTEKIKLGQENFDKAFTAVCYDANVLRTLLLSDFPSNKTQNLMGDLMFANHSFEVVSVSDDQVYIETSGQVGDEAVLRNMLGNVSHLARRFDDARKRLPKAQWEINLERSWNEFSSEKGLNFDAAGFVISGNLDGLPLKIKLQTSSGKWQTVFELKFPQSLQIGLKLMPENSVHKALTWVGVQDIETGVKEFDDAFIVKAGNVEIAKRKLQPDLCRHLTLLFKDTSAFIVDDDQFAFTLDTVIGEPAKLRGFAAAAIAAAQMLHR